MKNAARSGGSGRGMSQNGSEPPSPAGGHPGGIGDAEPAQVAEYVASMTAELAVLARASKLDFVAHLLDMARAAAAEAAGPASRR